MKTKLSIVSLVLWSFLFASFRSGAENEGELPFIINYNLPLKVTNHEHSDRYDYTEYTAGEDIIQLKYHHNITKEAAKKLVNDRKFFLTSTFKDHAAPYPGALSNTIGCPDAERPKPNEDTIKIRLDCKLLATKNLVYGNCNVNDNYYYCAYSVFFCPEKNELFELKIFTPIAKPSFDSDALISSIKCK